MKHWSFGSWLGEFWWNWLMPTASKLAVLYWISKLFFSLPGNTVLPEKTYNELQQRFDLLNNKIFIGCMLVMVVVLVVSILVDSIKVRGIGNEKCKQFIVCSSKVLGFIFGLAFIPITMAIALDIPAALKMEVLGFGLCFLVLQAVIHYYSHGPKLPESALTLVVNFSSQVGDYNFHNQCLLIGGRVATRVKECLEHFKEFVDAKCVGITQDGSVTVMVFFNVSEKYLSDETKKYVQILLPLLQSELQVKIAKVNSNNCVNSRRDLYDIDVAVP